jgi:chemotaxis family two-component system sensor kinase Cph1
MELLIDNLLSFSQAGKAVLRRERVDTAALVEEACEDLAPDFEGRVIEWNIEHLPVVFADQTLLKQVWVNLLSNAIKYSRKRQPAVITVSCRETDADYEFVVRDNGAGFDSRYAHKLFGVFHRLHSPEEFEGTGIGLANVHRIVTRHGGTIRADGEKDVGAAFFFTIPKTTTA